MAQKPIPALLASPWPSWALLAVPALPMLAAIATGSANYHRLLHPTGEWATRLMILAMLATPLRLLFPHRRWPIWLVRRRRHLGVAAFAYAALHTLFYLIDEGTLQRVLTEALRPGIWTGWLAFLIFVPLAATSNDWATRRLGRSWKPLQRWVYPAAALTLVHWLAVSRGPGAALLHFLPLVALEGWRVWRLRSMPTLAAESRPRHNRNTRPAECDRSETALRPSPRRSARAQCPGRATGRR